MCDDGRVRDTPPHGLTANFLVTDNAALDSGDADADSFHIDRIGLTVDVKRCQGCVD